MKILTRLIILVFIMAIALIVNSLFEYYSLSRAQYAIKQVYEGGSDQVQNLVNIRDWYELNIKNIAVKIKDGQISKAEGLGMIKEARNKISQEWEKYSKSLQASDDPSLAKFRENLPSLSLEIKGLDTIIAKMEDSKIADEAGYNQIVTNELTPATEKLLANFYQEINKLVIDTRTDYIEFNEHVRILKATALILLLLSLFIAITFAVWISYSISKPISRVLEDVNRFTRGDLSISNDDVSNDEIGHLRKALQIMAISNKKMADTLTSISEGDLSVEIEPRSDKDKLGIALYQMIYKLRKIIGELKSEVSVLTSSSEEILTSVSQVAAGSSETAAAVTETTTTVEELKQTSHVSDEKAKDVLRSSEDTLQVVNNSEKSLQNTLEDMRLIQGKMRSISEGIVKLSEHSQTIGNIIDTVNDLAEQSNLLAVNAAIEAAKAGEQGKSFGVVAQEIRTLAEQSKAATIQVRSILNDIQNSTSSAVLATEQGSKAVDKGVGQSSQTNDSMVLVTQGISQVAQAANQIAISCQQQFIGIDQVTVAMNNISEATTQHVDHMKQIETAVISLNSVGKTLKEIVDQYYINEEQHQSQPSQQELMKKRMKNKAEFTNYKS